MKIIYINSKKYGIKEVFVDDEDYDRVVYYNWSLKKSRNTFYARSWISETEKVPLHQFIIGKQKGKVIDHIDGNGLNNQRSNLRFCTNAQNSANCKRKIGATGYRGVHFAGKAIKHKVMYKAGIRVNYKNITIGYFNTPIEAAVAYNNAAIKHFGEFAVLNDIPCAE